MRNQMSKIKISKLDDNTVVATIHPDTPLELVDSLSKSFYDKGLYEDLSKSTLSKRYFYKEEDIADKLIKSLEFMAKKHKLSPEEEIKQYNEQKVVMDREGFGEKSWHLNKPGAVAAHNRKQKKIDEENRAKRANIKPPTQSKPITPTTAQPTVLPPRSNKLHSPELSGTVNYSKNPETTKKTEADKVQLEAENKFKKAWAEHLPFPSALEKVGSSDNLNGESVAAQQLADMMSNKSMFSQEHRQPTEEDFIMAGEQMGLGVSEKVLKSQEQSWGNAINNWYTEASKPLNARFSSEEEELAYWKNIGVSDNANRDSGEPGY